MSCTPVPTVLKLCASKRLGNGKAGAMAITKHKWYSGFDIEGLNNATLDSPLKSKIHVKSKEDAGNFDKYEEEPDNSVRSRRRPARGAARRFPLSRRASSRV